MWKSAGCFYIVLEQVCYFLFPEALSISEMCVLRECLPHSTNVDSAPFRQQLQACLRNLLVRARDSCLAKLKLQRSAASPPEEVLQMIGMEHTREIIVVQCIDISLIISLTADKTNIWVHRND